MGLRSRRSGRSAALVVVERRSSTSTSTSASTSTSTDVINVRYFRTTLGLSYSQFTVETADLHRKTPLRSLYIDETGLGAPVVEHAKELGLPAVGVKLTASMKEQIFSNLRILMEQKRLTIHSEPELLNALNCIEYERTRTGGYAFTHRPGTKDDLAYVLALA